MNEKKKQANKQNNSKNRCLYSYWLFIRFIYVFCSIVRIERKKKNRKENQSKKYSRIEITSDVQLR